MDGRLATICCPEKGIFFASGDFCTEANDVMLCRLNQDSCSIYRASFQSVGGG